MLSLHHWIVELGLSRVAAKKDLVVEAKIYVMFPDLLMKIWDFFFLGYHYQEYGALGYDSV